MGCVGYIGFIDNDPSSKFQSWGMVPSYSMFRMTTIIIIINNNNKEGIEKVPGPAAPAGRDVISCIFVSFFPG